MEYSRATRSPSSSLPDDSDDDFKDAEDTLPSVPAQEQQPRTVKYSISSDGGASPFPTSDIQQQITKLSITNAVEPQQQQAAHKPYEPYEPIAQLEASSELRDRESLQQFRTEKEVNLQRKIHRQGVDYTKLRIHLDNTLSVSVYWKV